MGFSRNLSKLADDIDSSGKLLPTAGGLPTQTSNSGKFLKTDGTSASWGILPSSLPVTTYSGSVNSVSVANGYLPVLQANGTTTTNVTVS